MFTLPPQHTNTVFLGYFIITSHSSFSCISTVKAPFECWSDNCHQWLLYINGLCQNHRYHKSQLLRFMFIKSLEHLAVIDSLYKIVSSTNHILKTADSTSTVWQVYFKSNLVVPAPLGIYASLSNPCTSSKTENLRITWKFDTFCHP